jgi:hypothetical protein
VQYIHTNTRKEPERVKKYLSDKYYNPLALINSKIPLVCVISTLVPLMYVVSIVGTVTADNSKYTIFPTNSTLNGVPYSELIKKWWIWNLGIPSELHPLRDPPDAKRCSAMQDGPIWFLPNALPPDGNPPDEYNYQCTIPSDKVIMIPISLSECDLGTAGEQSDEKLYDCPINIETPTSNVVIKIDGKEVDPSELKFIHTDGFFNVTYPTNSIPEFSDAEGNPIKGTFKAAAYGYSLFIHDLPVGEHNINTNVVDVIKGQEDLKGSGVTSIANYKILIK